MSAAYQIRVYENQQLLHTFECEGVVELGRQAEGENGPFRQKREAGRSRLVIAHLNEPSLSRKHVLIEPIALDRFRVTNLSSTQPLYSLEGGELKYQTSARKRCGSSQPNPRARACKHWPRRLRRRDQGSCPSPRFSPSPSRRANR